MKHSKLVGSIFVLITVTIAASSLQAQQLSLSTALALADGQNIDLAGSATQANDYVLQVALRQNGARITNVS